MTYLQFVFSGALSILTDPTNIFFVIVFSSFAFFVWCLSECPRDQSGNRPRAPLVVTLGILWFIFLFTFYAWAIEYTTWFPAA